MIVPAQKDEALLADIASVKDDGESLHCFWLGQSGFLVKQAGAAFLFDPYLSDSLTQKYATTDKPHVRMTERCIQPDRLTGITHVTASHIHTDHLDAATLAPLAQTNPGLKLFLPAPIESEARSRLKDAQVSLIALSQGEAYRDDDWQVIPIPAAHNDIKMDDRGRCHYLGFVIKRRGFSVYHSGDTLWHADLVPALLPHRCDLMLLPINGNRPERRVAGNLNGTEAAALAKACAARLAVPCHYEMFEFNTESPQEFISACERLSQPFRVLRCGERLVMDRAR